ncbi:hypothetical protein QYE76_025899 [Lolium multiflorum]|uniref:Retrotransposon gag domain-containing protein n=1 Tax=Lolium multiflorum TaxID=4521 RepID=A0AAD8RHP6_LOLMU|nr:hypothetical protein QYE76_025899 [Lolium multiflorum]
MVPKRRAIGYSKPYPNDYDLIPLPPKYRLPEFSKFSGSDGSSSIEHVSRYLAQLGTVSASDPLRVRFFAQSLTGSAFGWYTSLPPDSIRTWKQMEEQVPHAVSLGSFREWHCRSNSAASAEKQVSREYIPAFRGHREPCYSARLVKRVWRQQIQMAIEQGRLIFSQYAMKVDTHPPFPPVNMVGAAYREVRRVSRSASTWSGWAQQETRDEAVALVARTRRKPFHAIGSDTMASATSQREK